MQRRSGILLHPSSLPSPHGIGTLGADCFEFLDFLQETGQTLWHILPLGPTGYGDSPYQCFSAFAGNPLLIDPQELVELGLLTAAQAKAPTWAQRGPVDFGKLVPHADKVFRLAFAAFNQQREGELWAEFVAFYSMEGWWLHDFALFMTLKQLNGLRPWWEWEARWRGRDGDALEELNRDHEPEILYHKFLQFIFQRQWQRVRDGAQARGIRIVGDLPIFVAYDSADVWCWPHYFRLNTDGSLKVKTGVPPDYFAPTGQLWGNPHYDWAAMLADNYWWWRSRVSRLMTQVHTVRIDHFRGFEAAYEIPGDAQTAEHGEWVKSPGGQLFSVLTGAFPQLQVVAEDLGLITPEVEALKARFGFPGMKILQFAFLDGNAPFLPHNFEKHCVAFTGTHDNDTLKGFFDQADETTVQRACEWLDVSGPEKIRPAAIRALWRSSADWVVIPMQDWLGLGTEARMNIPGTPGGNWSWRLARRYRNRKDEQWLKELGRIYGRNQA
jgi:4-alpha-glucanotransferase